MFFVCSLLNYICVTLLCKNYLRKHKNSVIKKRTSRGDLSFLIKNNSFEKICNINKIKKFKKKIKKKKKKKIAKGLYTSLQFGLQLELWEICNEL